MRTSIDLTPYRRSTVGFDRLFDLLDNGAGHDVAGDYPPYDLVQISEGTYRIDIALAGYKLEDVEIVAQQNLLTVKGERAQENEPGEILHRGIPMRSFERRFQLADFVEVETAKFENGLLSITLKRVIPEAMKPRKIEISSGESMPSGLSAKGAPEPEAV